MGGSGNAAAAKLGSMHVKLESMAGSAAGSDCGASSVAGAGGEGGAGEAWGGGWGEEERGAEGAWQEVREQLGMVDPVELYRLALQQQAVARHLSSLEGEAEAQLRGALAERATAAEGRDRVQV